MTVWVQRTELQFVFPRDEAEAITASLLELASIADDDKTTPGGDQTLSLQALQALGNARPSNTKQLRQDVVRQRDIIRVQTRTRNKEPSGKATFQVVRSVARA